MRRGTTPTVTLTVDADISDWTLYVTFKSSSEKITFENNRLDCSYADDKTTILLTLTQNETLSLCGVCEVQVRAIKNGTAVATDIQAVDFGRILKEGVIYE